MLQTIERFSIGQKHLAMMRHQQEHPNLWHAVAFAMMDRFPTPPKRDLKRFLDADFGPCYISLYDTDKQKYLFTTPHELNVWVYEQTLGVNRLGIIEDFTFTINTVTGQYP